MLSKQFSISFQICSVGTTIKTKCDLLAYERGRRMYGGELSMSTALDALILKYFYILRVCIIWRIAKSWSVCKVPMKQWPKDLQKIPCVTRLESGLLKGDLITVYAEKTPQVLYLFNASRGKITDWCLEVERSTMRWERTIGSMGCWDIPLQDWWVCVSKLFKTFLYSKVE